MNCSAENCQASLTWFGHADDPALAAFARQSGWMVLEGIGWVCKRHAPQSRPRVWNKRDPNKPTDAVYVGRGTPWGNPFVLGRDGDRDTVCDRFEREVLPTLDVTPLIGRDLVCWCAPKRCHADALLAAALRAAQEMRK